MPVTEFTPRGWSPIKEGGWLALVDCDREWNRANPGLVGPVKVAGDSTSACASSDPVEISACSALGRAGEKGLHSPAFKSWRTLR